ncbi:MAG: hypothetical protein Q4G66_11915 [bacterium]|nr:hypothetical protein [bacterium]
MKLKDIPVEFRLRLTEVAMAQACLALVRLGYQPQGVPEPAKTEEEVQATRRLILDFMTSTFRQATGEDFETGTHGGNA